MAKKILLADDSITIQKVVELTFSDGDYEVTAVNNGAKAIQKLSEMRPDIILSDIIMPEKNGYEVCEFVKSHPDYRNIPVVLLTGTFEPFDPDRADKAGCDAVVTKPFESQSLIHKVEELIASSRANAAAAPAAAPAAPEPAPSPWMEEPAAPAPDIDSPFAPAPGFSTASPEPAFSSGNDLFGSAPLASPPTTEIPFGSSPASDPFGGGGEAPAFGGETRAFPRMSFDELSKMADEPAPPPPAAAPWDEPAAYSGETRAFPKMSFEEMQAMASGSAPAAPSYEPAYEPEPPFGGSTQETESPFGAQSSSSSSPFGESQPAADDFGSGGGETRAFPRMSFDELSKMADEPAPPPASVPFDDTPSFDSAPSTGSPWDEQPAAFSGETKAFPKMSFEEMQAMASGSAAAPTSPEPSPWDEPAAPSAAAPAWAEEEPAAAESSYSSPAATPFGGTDETPFAADAEPAFPPAEEPAWAAASEPESVEPEPVAPSGGLKSVAGSLVAGAVGAVVGAAAGSFVTGGKPADESAADLADLTDEQVDRIARRVVQLMSEQVVRNIAWEVIPDLAETVVKERIRQLEAEA
jgi:CheY-like chemotaxis protein